VLTIKYASVAKRVPLNCQKSFNDDGYRYIILLLKVSSEFCVIADL
jgi:hypothetical protein